jgi:hypothetical protein
VGSYRIDLHPSTGGRNYIDVSSLPFTIPLGSLIPVRVENLLPACKNLGVTHITNGCYRLHPVEWGIGEAAGALAAHCLETHSTPRAVRNTPKLLAEFQKRIVGSELPCFFFQHDGNIVANRIGQPVQPANENPRVALVLQRSLADGTSQYLEQARIHQDPTSF